MYQHIMNEWLPLGVRWLHVVAGIAWIGTSFYFNFLNHALRPPEGGNGRVGGELWAIHGGGFYHVEKFRVAPEHLPETLHWFKWEAYTTWLSGASLLILVYYMGPSSILVDPSIADISRTLATVIGVATLLGGWFLYDLLCRTGLVHRPVIFGVLLYGLVSAVAFGLSQIMAGRAAYIHVGALLGTWMAANVFRVIIPSQKNMVTSMVGGEEPDSDLGEQASMRSLHNNYFTLPVVFMMISSHFPSTYGSTWNWAVLAVLSLSGVLIRHWFNLRGRDRQNAFLLPGAALLLIGLALTTAPRNAVPATGVGESVDNDRAFSIVQNHCAACHSAVPTQEGFSQAPRGLTFDSVDELLAAQELVEQMAIRTQVMPPGNITGMTEEERAELGQWLQSHRSG